MGVLKGMLGGFGEVEMKTTRNAYQRYILMVRAMMIFYESRFFWCRPND